MKRFLAISFCLVICLSACLPSLGQPNQSGDVNSAVQTALAATKAVEDSAATMVAATLAAGQTGGQSQPPQSVEPTATPTATIVPPTNATANNNVNCRSGPATNFDVVVVINQGDGGNVVGKNTVHDLWYQLKLADEKQCWVSGDALTVTGDTGSVPEVASPPTPTPVAPASLWAGTWTTWENVCFNNTSDCEQVITITFTMTGPNTLYASYSGFGCDSITTSLTVSADGYSADGSQSYQGGQCGNTVEAHLKLDPNKNQFRGRVNIVGYSSLDAYWCGARNGFGKPSPTR